MSAEHLKMFRAMRELAAENESAVLATVVRVAGSAYRSLGARMLILRNGQRIGSVSGGCIEGEIVTKGWWWTEDGRAYLRRYDTAIDGDDDGYGLACNGSIEVLVERIYPGDVHSPLAMLEGAYRRRVNSVLATVFAQNSDGGACILGRFALDKGDICAGDLNPEAVAAVLPHMRAAMADRVSCRMSLEGSLEAGGSPGGVVLEFVEPPLQLVVCGAGFDAVPLVRFAAQLGWRVVVCDGRDDLAKAERFPEAEHVFTLDSIEDLRRVERDERTACVIMTHSYEQDKALLSYWLPKGLPYLGVLGARSRTREMLDVVETPEEIALSIVAEIRAHFANRSGGPLRDRSGSIHIRTKVDRVEASLAS